MLAREDRGDRLGGHRRRTGLDDLGSVISAVEEVAQCDVANRRRLWLQQPGQGVATEAGPPARLPRRPNEIDPVARQLSHQRHELGPPDAVWPEPLGRELKAGWSPKVARCVGLRPTASARHALAARSSAR